MPGSMGAEHLEAEAPATAETILNLCACFRAVQGPQQDCAQGLSTGFFRLVAGHSRKAVIGPPNFSVGLNQQHSVITLADNLGQPRIRGRSLARFLDLAGQEKEQAPQAAGHNQQDASFKTHLRCPVKRLQCQPPCDLKKTRIALNFGLIWVFLPLETCTKP